ncbi:MAG: cytochrome P450 [bacterium]|nr:cytochrome P450 [bacterium]
MAVDATIEDQLASLELVSDPYPLYDELRERHPVYWSQGWNAFLVTRYDDVVDVLRDSRRFVNAGRYTLFMEQLPPERRVEFGQFYEYWTKPGFNLSDPPDHALVRTLAKRFFTRRAMERIRPRVQALVDALIDDVIGTGILSLHQHPDQLRLLRNDPSLLPPAIAEMLRYEPPFQQDWRRSATDTEIRGVRIPEGSILRLMLAAANRDPRVFDAPGAFDIRRDPNRHIAFGFGIHLCVGAPLAEVELDIAFNTLLRRLNSLQVATDTLEWHPSNGPRGLKTLPITFQPGPRVSGAPRPN